MEIKTIRISSYSYDISALLYSKFKNNKVVVIIHGAGMNNTTGISDFIPKLSKSYTEYDYIVVNMHAHDIGYINNGYNCMGGWAWQSIDENECDLTAVFDYLNSVGYKRIVLCAHSWGALISLDYLQKTNCKVDKIILLSPTMSYQLLLEVNYRQRIDEVVKFAKECVSKGITNQLVLTNEKSLIPYISVKTILQFYDSSFNVYDYLKNTAYDVSIIIGSLEHKKLLEKSLGLSFVNNNIKTYILNGANHFYRKCEIDLSQLIDTILGE